MSQCNLSQFQIMLEKYETCIYLARVEKTDETSENKKIHYISIDFLTMIEKKRNLLQNAVN